MRLRFAIASTVVFFATVAFGADPQSDLSAALANARSGVPALVQRSIVDLRSAGPAGLEALLRQYDAEPDATLIPAIDAVAGQRGAVVSRLYWYTDLAEAEAAAKAQGKPILYLRLLGKLTDEYSCANSRFFRTVLYSNKNVSALLRERFVLVWSSERPVPVITVDYGDGRTLKRTITGNSIHYVLSPDGRVFDALPGLFDPASFARIVAEAGAAARGGDDMLRGRYLQRADDAILRQWRQDVTKIQPQLLAADSRFKQVGEKADAAMAMRRAISKSMVEVPLLRAMAPQFASMLDESIDSADAAAWRQIAALHTADATLDGQSIAVIRGQNPSAYADPAALDRTVAEFQKTIAEDTVRDNYQLRRQALAWLRQSPAPIGLDDLNRRVYSELFLTPRSDPWLGLAPEGTYTALTNDGCCEEGRQ